MIVGRCICTGPQTSSAAPAVHANANRQAADEHADERPISPRRIESPDSHEQAEHGDDCGGRPNQRQARGKHPEHKRCHRAAHRHLTGAALR